jgi:CheY-like chemotaxis protein
MMSEEKVEFVEDETVNIKSVSDMLRTTGTNTAEFMTQVANHIDKLEDAVVQLKNRITELEKVQNG